MSESEKLTPRRLRQSELSSGEVIEDTWRQRAQEEVRRGESCPACLGVGWVRAGEYPVGHPRYGVLDPCPICTRGKIPEYLRAASGLRGWQLQSRLSEYLMTETRRPAYEAAQRLIEKGWGWLTYWGSYGTSKTFLLTAIVNECLERNLPAVYVTAGGLLDHLRSAYGPRSIGYSAAFDYWVSCQVLAIDEADSYHDTSWANDKYRQLLDTRYNLACDHQTITVFASNPEPGVGLWPPELDWLGSRMSHFEIVSTDGEDVRPLLGEEGSHGGD